MAGAGLWEDEVDIEKVPKVGYQAEVGERGETSVGGEGKQGMDGSGVVGREKEKEVGV